MKFKRQFALLCFALAFLLTQVHAQIQPVHAWEGVITISTYKLGPVDPNPPFPLVNSQPVYPYTMLDNLTNDRVPKTYRAIYLENKYLKITILPQLGGHVYSVYDKIDHREVLYRNHVIKYGLVGPRGAWISGGMEFSFPFAHTTDTVSSVESVLRHNPDGSATSVVGAIDWVSNMHWEIAITLRPNTASVEEGVTLFNSTPANHLYLFWTNTAVKATDDAQYIYPMRETVFDDPFAIVQSWPVWKGVNRSWYKNDPDALAIFGHDVHRNFFGVYYHQANYGVVHVANFRQDPGKKFWTWGTARSGKIWDKILSDNDGSYNEIQSGRFYTQGSREFLNPRRVEQWTEYWYPVRGLDGGYVEATGQMAINAIYSSGDQLNLIVSPVAQVSNATIVVKDGSKLLKRFSGVDFTPLQPASFTIPLHDVASAEKNLNVDIQSARGKVLLQWSAAAPIDGNPDLIPSVGKPLATRLTITPHTPIEQLYFQGVFLQKTENPLGAMKVFDQVLKRDPGYVPALVKEAWYDYSTANFQKAQSLIQRANQRGQEDPTVAYAAGVIDRAAGRMSLAKDAFWRSIHYGAAMPAGPFLASSYVELGEIAIYQSNYTQAEDLLQRAVEYNPKDVFALADLAAAERLGGDLHGAAQDSGEAVRAMPLLPYALAENWLDMSASSGDTGWTKIISSDPQNYLAIASWYYNIGAWKSSNSILHAAIDNLPAKNISPMIYYYLAANARRQGNMQQAQQFARKAASLPAEEVFPNRLTDVAVLVDAIRRNPADAHAKYALGNFLFARARYKQAADQWSEALAEGDNNPVLLRNLGVYQWRVQKNLSRASQFYRRAIQLAPNDYRLYTSLDEIYEQQGNTAARVDLFHNAPPEVLDQDTVRARQALLLIEQAKPEQALALLVSHHFKPWEGGVVIHNMYVLANMEQGKKTLAGHQPAQAIEAFHQAMQYPENLGTGAPSHPDNSEQLYWIGNALQAEGKDAAAKASWTLASMRSTVFSALADRKLGQDEQARQILEQKIRSASTSDATANDYLAAGMAERASGKMERAHSDIEHALQLDPMLWQARIALDNMNRAGN